MDQHCVTKVASPRLVSLCHGTQPFKMSPLEEIAFSWLTSSLTLSLFTSFRCFSLQCLSKVAWFKEISMLPGWKVIRNSKGKGVFNVKVFKAKYEAKLEFPEEGWGWGYKPKTLLLGEYGYFLEEHFHN